MLLDSPLSDVFFFLLISYCQFLILRFSSTIRGKLLTYLFCVPLSRWMVISNLSLFVLRYIGEEAAGEEGEDRGKEEDDGGQEKRATKRHQRGRQSGG